jgi:acyl-CoA reductase-like NAD-dependent aldehyde dehydrogenase
MAVNLSTADFAVINETTGVVELVPVTFTVCVGRSSAEAALTCRNATLGKNPQDKKPALAVMIAAIVVAGVTLIRFGLVVVLC